MPSVVGTVVPSVVWRSWRWDWGRGAVRLKGTRRVRRRWWVGRRIVMGGWGGGWYVVGVVLRCGLSECAVNWFGLVLI